MRKVFLAIALLALATPAMAQTRPVAPRLPDPLHLIPGSQGNSGAVTPNSGTDFEAAGTSFQKVAKEVVDKALLDLAAASKDAAGQVPPDMISQPCWDAQATFLKLLPVEWETPPTDVGPALAIQIGRDLRRALTSDTAGSIKVACAALFGDELNQLAKLGSLVGLRILTGGLAG